MRREGESMLVVMRFQVAAQTQDSFADRARVALERLAACAGYLRGTVGRAYDDPTQWCLMTEWESVGAYRRALGNYEVKVHATPLLAESLDEPSAFEPLAVAAPGGEVTVAVSDRAGT
jgi:Antibiotic biosynthesis monooxygenase